MSVNRWLPFDRVLRDLGYGADFNGFRLVLRRENHKIFWYSALFSYLCSIRTCQASSQCSNRQVVFFILIVKTSFTKPYSSPEQIVQILKSRGMLMENEHKAESYLLNIGYHRLSAYIYPFYKSPKSDLMLKEGTTFEQVLTLYRFDKKLRMLLFNEIEKIEVAIRSVLADIGCQELDDRYRITKPRYFANADKFNQT